MGAGKIALELHSKQDKKFNCAQCVLCSLLDYLNITEEVAYNISSGFGGGVRCREICGSICGGVMAIGLAFPGNNGLVSELSKNLTSAFIAEFGCIRCEELKQQKVSCDTSIKFCADLVEDLIITNKNII